MQNKFSGFDHSMLKAAVAASTRNYVEAFLVDWSPGFMIALSNDELQAIVRNAEVGTVPVEPEKQAAFHIRAAAIGDSISEWKRRQGVNALSIPERSRMQTCPAVAEPLKPPIRPAKPNADAERRLVSLSTAELQRIVAQSPRLLPQQPTALDHARLDERKEVNDLLMKRAIDQCRGTPIPLSDLTDWR